MTRIIGGVAGGRRISSPAGERTRPTSDRVREALFSSLEATVGSLSGLRFLDAYAGSGAVGLEARSRGAGVVTLVEQDRRTAEVIGKNIRSLSMTGTEVVVEDVARAASRPPRAPYDVIFLDPPYAVPVAEVVGVLTALRDHGWLGHRAVVVVERGLRGPSLAWPDGYTADRSRRYGDTVLWYGHASAPPGARPAPPADV